MASNTKIKSLTDKYFALDRKRKASDDGDRSSKRHKKEDDSEKQAKGEGGGLAEMSVDGMNALRAKLGLPPLK